MEYHFEFFTPENRADMGACNGLNSGGVEMRPSIFAAPYDRDLSMRS